MKMTPELIQAQRNQLQYVAQQLKSEFIGLDSIIDQIIEGVTAWACVPGCRSAQRLLAFGGSQGLVKAP